MRFCPLQEKSFRPGTISFTPTRSQETNLKQICLWDLAQSIWIVFIIQTV